MNRGTQLLVAVALVLVTGCAAVPAGQPPARTDVPVSRRSPSATVTAEPSPTGGACSASVEIDPEAHGRTFRGAGFPPEVPLTMTLSNEAGSTTYTQAELPELQSDVRGAWNLHWFAARADIGPSTLELSGGGCVASTAFEVPADRFPEADCEPATKPSPTGSEAADAYAQAVLDDEPLTYWRFEERTGDPEDSVTGDSAANRRQSSPGGTRLRGRISRDPARR